ncbi:hypothetical protein M9Y10_030283 [Tritrichomonas musculus]|uniref:Uncharacterized protein n=1 Tax=Tritrichomonas musculus TaxID=1915356 RepID=A0ABR2KQC6_9EUKA
MILGGQHEIGIEIIGTNCTVPDSHMACLMYYLRSVNSLCDFGIPNNLTNFDNYNKLSFDQENAVLCFAALLNPKIFIEKNIMIYQPELCGNCKNEFFKISDSRTAVAATREFIIGGKQVHTLRIMAFKESWLENYYINPMKYYSRRLQAIEDGSVDDYKPKPVSYSSSSKSSSSRSSTPKKHSRSCIIC